MAFNFYTSSCSDDIWVICLLDITLILLRFSHLSNHISSTCGVLVSCLLKITLNFVTISSIGSDWFFWRFSHCNKFVFIHNPFIFLVYLFLNHHSCEAKNSMAIMSLACLAERTLANDRRFLLSFSTQMFASARKHHLFCMGRSHFPWTSNKQFTYGI